MLNAVAEEQGERIGRIQKRTDLLLNSSNFRAHKSQLSLVAQETHVQCKLQADRVVSSDTRYPKTGSRHRHCRIRRQFRGVCHGKGLLFANHGRYVTSSEVFMNTSAVSYKVIRYS
eukprot:4323440-Pleurochrysis_carterae.AAC.1